MNIYAKYADKYIEKEISVIPDKYKSKQPAIKGWSDYSYKLPSQDEINNWSKHIPENGIAAVLGQTSNLVVLDIDATDDKILKAILPLLPSSPVVKVGAKGESRFFQFRGEASQSLAFNGETILEILSNNKKTTLPPSIHPNGMAYKWKEASLLDVDIATLPILPPMLFSHVESHLRSQFPDLAVKSGFKMASGRNSALSSYCAKLIQDRVPIDEAIKKLIEKDKEEHETPLFSDHTELRHTESFTNALQFYSNHLSGINAKRFQKKEHYEVPTGGLALVPVGKSQNQVNQPSEKKSLPVAQGVLGNLIQNILDNSYIKQPEFAYASALTLMSGLVSRKMVYNDLSPNLYTLILGPSGCGKNAPLQYIKRTLLNIGAESILGSGDFVSDASLIDSLPNKPVRVDVIDEASKILSVANSAKNGYDSKMADILCELYTSSSDKFLGRAMASQDGSMTIRGSCYRPNVNMICGTTPSGFSHAVTPKSLEKGLLGRFLIFLHDQNAASEALERQTPLEAEDIQHLTWLYKYRPPTSDDYIQNISQNIYKIPASDEARKEMSGIFKRIDILRRNTEYIDPMLPVISRLYQQIIKVAILHSAGRHYETEPTLEKCDITFANSLIEYFYGNMQLIVDRYLYSNRTEKYTKQLLNIISDADNITHSALTWKTVALSKREREEALKALEESGKISKDVEVMKDGSRNFIYRSIA
jgi:hypothetical protein